MGLSQETLIISLYPPSRLPPSRTPRPHRRWNRGIGGARPPGLKVDPLLNASPFEISLPNSGRPNSGTTMPDVLLHLIYTPATVITGLSTPLPYHKMVGIKQLRMYQYRNIYQLLITYISTVMAGHMDHRQPAAKPVMMSGFARGPGDLQFLMPNECDSSPFDYQSILMKDHFMGTAVFL